METFQRKIGLTGLILLAVLSTPLVAVADALARVEWMVNKRFDIPEVTVAEAQAELSTHPEDWLVLDVREPDEYAVSHLAGAVRVPPDTDVETFVKDIGDAAKDKHLLFYCSVGQRSSKLAARVQDAVREAGGNGVTNLRGGIFRWHGEHGALVNGGGAVDRIHPYNAVWGLLMPRGNPPKSAADHQENPL